MLLVGVVVDLVLTAALFLEVFDERPVDGLDAGAVFDQEFDFLESGVFRREMKGGTLYIPTGPLKLSIDISFLNNITNVSQIFSTVSIVPSTL